MVCDYLHVHCTCCVCTFQVGIVLTETETIWLLDIPGTCVALDSEEAQLVKKRNEEYQEVTCACTLWFTCLMTLARYMYICVYCSSYMCIWPLHNVYINH